MTSGPSMTRVGPQGQGKEATSIAYQVLLLYCRYGDRHLRCCLLGHGLPIFATIIVMCLACPLNHQTLQQQALGSHTRPVPCFSCACSRARGEGPHTCIRGRPGTAHNEKAASVQASSQKHCNNFEEIRPFVVNREFVLEFTEINCWNKQASVDIVLVATRLPVCTCASRCPSEPLQQIARLQVTPISAINCASCPNGEFQKRKARVFASEPKACF